MLGALVKAGACIVLGAATTVAVAWGLALHGVPILGPWNEIACAAWTNPSSGDVTVYGEGRSVPGTLRIHLMRGPGLVGPDSIQARLGGGLRIRDDPPYPRVTAPPRPCHPPEGRANCRSEYQFGWPLICLWAATDTEEGGCSITGLGTQNAWRIWSTPKPIGRPSFGEGLYPFSPGTQRTSWFVPTGILWRPVAIDSTVYCAAWWLGLIAPGIVRRTVRRRRGRCVACGYDLTANTSGVCPECGATIRGSGQGERPR